MDEKGGAQRFPNMAAPDLTRIPVRLRASRRWRNWRWLPDRTRQGKFAKRPWHPEADGGGFKVNGHILSTAMAFDEATSCLDWRTGLGIVMGEIEGELPLIEIDLDWKEFPGQWYSGDARYGSVPLAAYKVCRTFEDAGALVEPSPSGMGAHIIVAASLPTGHGTRFTIPEGLGGGAELIGGEVYSTGRWLTFTGRFYNEDAASLTLEPSERTQALVDQLATWITSAPARRTGTAGDVSIELRRAEQVVAVHLTGELSVFKGERLAPLWDGTAEGDASRLDYRLCLTLFEVLGDDAQQVADAFAMSGRWRDKCTRVHVQGMTYLQATVSRARAEWVSKGSKRFEPVGQPTSASAGWTDADRDWLIAHLFDHTKGSKVARDSTANLLRVLFDLERAGECHLHDGRIYVHHGGLVNLTRLAGGRTTVLMQKLEWMAGQGYLAVAHRDARGALQVALHQNLAVCPVAQEGLQQPDVTPPVNPSKPRPTTRAERTKRQGGDPIPPGEMRRCVWTMWSIHAGARSIEEIAEHTKAASRTIRQHLATLRTADMVNDAMEPTISRELYAASVIAERRLGQVRTEEHRQRATPLWRSYCDKRGQRQPLSAAREAELGAWDSASIPFQQEMDRFDAWLCGDAAD